MRLMKQHNLTVRPRSPFVAAINSAHGGPIFLNLAKDVAAALPRFTDEG